MLMGFQALRFVEGHRFSVILFTLLLPACPGSVEVEGEDAFGPVASAIWLDIEFRPGVDGSERLELLLSNNPGLCGLIQGNLSQAHAFWSSSAGAGGTTCPEYNALLGSSRAAQQRIHPEGSKSISLGSWENSGLELGEGHGDAQLIHHSADSAGWGDWRPNPEGDPEADCEPWLGEEGEPAPSWYFDGSLEITAVDENLTRTGRFDGERAAPLGYGDDEPVEPGTLTVQFEARRCEVVVEAP